MAATPDPEAHHGSCPCGAGCGSTPLREPIGHDRIAVSSGAFDDPTGTRLATPIFVGDQGDHADDVPRNIR